MRSAKAEDDQDLRIDSTAAFRSASLIFSTGLGAIGTGPFKEQIAGAGLRLLELDQWQQAGAVLVSGHNGFNYDELKAAAMAPRAGLSDHLACRDGVTRINECVDRLVRGAQIAMADRYDAASGQHASEGDSAVACCSNCSPGTGS